MDLANYASDLLKQHGELNVPGLGHFSHERKSSYYDKQTGTLYPPYYEVTFEPFEIDEQDNHLIEYLSEKKSISLASARFFLDKYVSNIKLQAETAEIDFGDLGFFYADYQGRLAFRSNQTDLNFSASLFGYGPVPIQKLEDYGKPVTPRAEQPVYIPPAPKEPTKDSTADEIPYLKKPISDEGAVQVTNLPPSSDSTSTPPDDDYMQVQHEPLPDDANFLNTSNARYWLIIGISVIVAVVAVLGVYKYYDQKNQVTNVKKATAIDTFRQHVDTVDQADLMKNGTAPSTTTPTPADSLNPADTATIARQPAQANAQPVPSPTNTQPQPAAQNTPVAPQPGQTIAPIGDVPKNTWLIVGNSFANLASAKKMLIKYHSWGFPQARLLDSLPRKEYFLYKIILGYRYTQKDANAARLEVLKTRKIKPKYITVQPYK